MGIHSFCYLNPTKQLTLLLVSITHPSAESCTKYRLSARPPSLQPHCHIKRADNGLTTLSAAAAHAVPHAGPLGAPPLATRSPQASRSSKWPLIELAESALARASMSPRPGFAAGQALPPHGAACSGRASRDGRPVPARPPLRRGRGRDHPATRP